MRELRNQEFNNAEYVDENFLYSGKLLGVDTIGKELTYLQGKDTDMYPLTFLTEGSGNIVSKKLALNDTQYTWDVMGKMKYTNRVVGLYDSNVTTAGKGHTPFKVYFETAQFPKDHTALTPDHAHLVRIQGEPQKLANNKFLYTMVIISADPSEYISLDNFLAGNAWVMNSPIVALSKSTGNRSNRTTPGKLTNQMSLHRHSLEIAGNISNKATVYEFDTEGGGKTKMWMPEEMRQFNITRKVMDEQNLWISKYNRNEFGVITTIDDETGQPIPMGAGVKEQIKASGNYSTYTELSIDMLESMIDRIYMNRTSEGDPEIVIYAGKGFKRMFHDAIKSKATNGSTYYERLGDAEIKELGLNLQYGRYFNSYRTIDNRIITIADCGVFDKGAIAQMDIENNNTYRNLAIDSYTGIFLDHSLDSESGSNNIQMVTEKGRELLTGIYRGMSPLPDVWGAVPQGTLGTTKDIASYEMMYSRGIAMKNNTTSFMWEFGR